MKKIIIGIVIIITLIVFYLLLSAGADALYNAKSVKLVGIGDTVELEMTIETKITRTQEDLLEEKQMYEMEIQTYREQITRFQAEIDEINDLLKNF